MTWEQWFSALIDLNGDAWNAEHEQLERAWLAAYTANFVEIAIARGWRRDDAVIWPIGIGDEAFIEAHRHAWDPRLAAGVDVIACEEPP